MSKKILFFSIIVLGSFFTLTDTEAATLFFSPASKTLSVGDSYDVSIRVDSQGQGFNAVQAAVQYPKDILKINAIHSSGADSTFNFWLEEPVANEARGTVSFIGGTTNGVVGASIPILRISFTVVGGGSGTITASDAAIAASDGSGTNILSEIRAGGVTVLPKVTGAPTQTTPAPEAKPPEIPREILQEITRPATPSTRLPEKTQLQVPTYPDQKRWYNVTTDFLGQWTVPDDVSGVSTLVDQNRDTVPPAKREGLFAGKIFPALEDGIWYLHARFQNNKGWGPAVHYRIAIDTSPPLPFEIAVDEGLSTDVPAPTIHFPVHDGLSNIDRYVVSINGIEATTTISDTATLPLQPPGTHAISVRAYDAAGNSTESTADLNIIPLPSPVITSISSPVFVGEGGLTIRGISGVTTTILLSLKKKDGEVVANRNVVVDSLGNWETTIDTPLRYGNYIIEILARDPRGALSFPVSSAFRVRERPILSIAGIGITKAWFFAGIVLILLAGIALGWVGNRRWHARAGRKAAIVQRDIVNLTANTEKDIDTMLAKYTDRQIDERESREIEFLLKKMKNDLKKIERYILNAIKDIPD